MTLSVKPRGGAPRRRCSGQVMTEYVVMLGLFLGVALLLTLLLAVFSEYGWRIISLVGLEYP